jgi:sec-independent protein translocase protein TatC
MSLRDHLTELRTRLLKAMFWVLVGAIVGWIVYPTILEFLKAPYCDLPADKRFQSAGSTECQLAFFGPLDGFMLRLKVGVVSGIALASPFWLYQLWAFITPGLHRHERRWSMVFVVASSLLFAAGAVLSYFTVSNALELLFDLAGPGTISVIGADKYVSFVMSMLLVFGVSFELPLLVVMLNRVGVLAAARLLKWQRLAIFLIFLFAAVATPSQDPLSMCMLAFPMVLLYEVSVLIAWVHDRRKARREAASPYAGLSDDDASPMDDEMPSRSDNLTSIDDIH